MEILGLVENMSGLQCPYCGKTIDAFKQKGGSLTAESEHLKLLTTLPLVPEVVSKGDVGDMSLLDNLDNPFTWEFDKMVTAITNTTVGLNQSRFVSGGMQASMP